MITRRAAATIEVPLALATPPVPLSPGTGASSPCAVQAVQTLKIRASVERAMIRAKQRETTPETSDERAQRAQRTEARAHDLARQEKWGAAARAGLRAAQLEPTNARRWARTTRWQRQDGDPYGAVETARRALKHLETDAPNRELRTLLAEALLECGQWEACVQECRTLIQHEPRHHAALETLATALLHQGQVAEAAETFRKLLCLSPRDSLHRLKLAALLHVQGHLGAALREFERVVAMSPSPEWTREAHEAIESLDRLQIEGIMLCVNRSDIRGEEFRRLVERDLDAALARHDFYLSEMGRETLQHLLGEGRTSAAATALLPRVH